MEDIFSILFFVGMAVIGIVGQVKKGASNAAPSPVPSPDEIPPEENDLPLFDPEEAVAPFPPAAAPPQAHLRRERAAVSKPASTSKAPTESVPTEGSLTDEIRRGIIWSEILHRKYC